MCGRYALALRPSEIRALLQNSHMPAQEAPDDDDVRQTYNFAPGYYGLVYRADVPDTGAGGRPEDASNEQDDDATESVSAPQPASPDDSKQVTPQYKLQAMKWGLVPFWTKRNPDYQTLMRTINCRDDSLAQGGGMWASMKKKKRCIVVAQGFYEWLKKNDGKERLPHFTKRKDGQLLCFAGLWDCVKYEGSDEKLYTYTIITTDVNQQLKFLHDRMPVIFDNGSEEMFKWLDSNKTEWDKELQSLLKPYDGPLECYQVTKDVGKVGNNSPTFIVPIDSTDNKQNIANFFGNQKKKAANKEVKQETVKQEAEALRQDSEVKVEPDVDVETVIADDNENNAPKPVAGSKRGPEDSTSNDAEKAMKMGSTLSGSQKSPVKSPPLSSSKKARSATSNVASPPKKASKPSDGSMKITGFLTSK